MSDNLIDPYDSLRFPHDPPLADREAARQRHRDRAIAEADRIGRSLVCVDGVHARCRGEQTGALGCLCECHDARPAEPTGRFARTLLSDAPTEDRHDHEGRCAECPDEHLYRAHRQIEELECEKHALAAKLDAVRSLVMADLAKGKSTVSIDELMDTLREGA